MTAGKGDGWRDDELYQAESEAHLSELKGLRVKNAYVDGRYMGVHGGKHIFVGTGNTKNAVTVARIPEGLVKIIDGEVTCKEGQGNKMSLSAYGKDDAPYISSRLQEDAENGI